MTEHAQAKAIVRFGVFELNLRAGELRKSGVKIRVQEQPFRLLAMLVENPGEVVTRKELRDRLWPADTYVDFDNGLNTAASKLRDALGDSASNPRFIETLPRRGYRFLAPIQAIGNGSGSARASNGTEALLGAKSTHSDNQAPRGWQRLAWPALTLLLLGVIAVMWSQLHEPTIEIPFRRFALYPGSAFESPVISPDGRQVAYVSGGAVWVQDLARDEPRKVAASGTRLAWSPDSQALVYASNTEVRRVAASGSADALLQDIGQHISSLCWSSDGARILFTATGEESLQHLAVYWIPSSGGDPKLLFEPDRAVGESPYRYSRIQVIPGGDGKDLLLASRRTIRRSVGESAWDIVVRNLQTGRESVVAKGFNPFYSATGHVLYQARDASGLWAIPFSIESMQVTGDAFSVREGALTPSAALDRTLVYTDFGETGSEERLAWRDRQGVTLGMVGQRQDQILYPEISPNGKRVAVSGREQAREHIWVHEIARPLKVRATRTEGWYTRGPLWLSAKEIVYSSSRGRVAGEDSRRVSMGIYLTVADSSADERLIYRSDDPDVDVFASDVSPDGRRILYDSHPKDQNRVGLADIGYLEREVNGDFVPKPFLTTVFGEKGGKFSPDGRWVAYVSDEPGEPEVYVCRFPQGDRKRRVSQQGGAGPRWSQDGKKLYYIQETRLIETDVAWGEELSFGPPRVLFDEPKLDFNRSSYPHYDVSPDGNRFLVRESAVEPTIRIVQNWFAEFQNKAIASRDQRNGP